MVISFQETWSDEERNAPPHDLVEGGMMKGRWTACRESNRPNANGALAIILRHATAQRERRWNREREILTMTLSARLQLL